MIQIKWLPWEDRILKENFHLTFYSIQKLLPHRSISSINNRALYLKLKKYQYGKSKYTFNDKFWSEPNLINSYWAGQIAADGCVRKQGKCTILSISINAIDRILLDTFIKDIEYTGSYFPHTRLTKKGNISKMLTLRLNGLKQAEIDLENIFNIVPLKTKILKPANLSDDLQLAYIVGYTDGDGCIFCNDKALMVKYVSCSSSIIEWLNIFLNMKFPIKIRKRISKIKNYNNQYYQICFCGIQAAIIIDTLRQLPIPKLDRKWNNPKVLDRIEKYKKEFPKYFNVV